MTYQEYRLGDICRLVKGTFSSTKTLPGEYPLVVTAAQRRTADGFDLEGPAVCIPLISSTGHGDAAIHRLHYQEGPFALANLLVALIPLPDSPANAEYLYWYLTAKKDEVLVPLMRGTANVSLKEKDIAEVYVPLPPLPEQQRIVARVKGLLDKVEEARHISDANAISLTSLKSRLLNSLLEQYQTEKFIMLEELITDIRYGTSEKTNDDSKGLAVFRMGNIQDGILNFENFKYLPASRIGGLSMLSQGDILINRTNSAELVGKCAPFESDGRYTYASYIIKITPNHSLVNYRFLSDYINSPAAREYLTANIKQMTGQANINSKTIKSLPIPAISLSDQKRIIESLDSYNSLTLALRQERLSVNTELQALPAAILAQAFAGAL